MLIDMLETIIGEPTIYIDPVTLSQVRQYDIEYICAFIAFMAFNIGVFVLICTLQKTLSYRKR